MSSEIQEFYYSKNMNAPKIAEITTKKLTVNDVLSLEAGHLWRQRRYLFLVSY